MSETLVERAIMITEAIKNEIMVWHTDHGKLTTDLREILEGMRTNTPTA